ncbi:hypothetical protein ACQP00_01775 [Dactylosporangium sp. CS-047395]|uniref:hypothetical protein n=1 Tax=Dactylosporangium sp. CS-047395 TaxID=3239936 RepID=UPI003D8EC7A9
MAGDIWGWKTFANGGPKVAEARDWLLEPDLTTEPTWLVFVRGVRPVLPAPSGWPRTRPEDFGAWLGATFESVTCRLLAGALREDHVRSVWPDDQYPYRVDLDPDEEDLGRVRAADLNEDAVRAIRHSAAQKGWPILGPPLFRTDSLAPDKHLPAPAGRETVVRTIPLERNRTTTFERRPGETVVAARKEAGLVERYQKFIRDTLGHHAVRNEITLPGELDTFFTDVYVEEIDELLEAKSSSRREHIRLAIGQLCDYARFVEPTSRAVLLPERPDQDLIDLLETQDIDCVYEHGPGRFERAPRRLTREG